MYYLSRRVCHNQIYKRLETFEVIGYGSCWLQPIVTIQCRRVHVLTPPNMKRNQDIVQGFSVTSFLKLTLESQTSHNTQWWKLPSALLPLLQMPMGIHHRFQGKDVLSWCWHLLKDGLRKTLESLHQQKWRSRRISTLHQNPDCLWHFNFLKKGLILPRQMIFRDGRVSDLSSKPWFATAAILSRCNVFLDIVDWFLASWENLRMWNALHSKGRVPIKRLAPRITKSAMMRRLYDSLVLGLRSHEYVLWTRVGLSSSNCAIFDDAIISWKPPRASSPWRITRLSWTDFWSRGTCRAD